MAQPVLFTDVTTTAVGSWNRRSSGKSVPAWGLPRWAKIMVKQNTNLFMDRNFHHAGSVSLVTKV